MDFGDTFTPANIKARPEVAAAETVENLVDPQPAVTVSIDQLKTIELGPIAQNKRYNRIPFDDFYSYIEAAKLTPHYRRVSPYDEWKVWSVKPAYEIGDNMSPKRSIYEMIRPAKLVPWLPYITTTFLQSTPDRFLEYLRFIRSASGNPWMEFVNHGTEEKSARDYWADTMTGEETKNSTSPPLPMYPHVVMEDGTYNYAITVDRFQETAIYYALNQAFTIMDISRTDDPEFLKWCYEMVINRLPEIKSFIKDESYVKIRKDNKTDYQVPVTINWHMQQMLNRAADDALVIIRQKMDFLAERTIEVTDKKANNVPTKFIGPSWLNPLTTIDISEEEIMHELANRPVMTRAEVPTGMAIMSSAPIKAKRNLALPVAGVAAAAVGLYALTR